MAFKNRLNIEKLLVGSATIFHFVPQMIFWLRAKKQKKKCRP